MHTIDTTTTDMKIINDDVQRSLKIIADAGVPGITYAIMHPRRTRRHLRAVIANQPKK